MVRPGRFLLAPSRQRLGALLTILPHTGWAQQRSIQPRMPGVLRSGHLRLRSLPAVPLRPPGPRPPAQPPARGCVSLRTEATREASEGSAGSASEERRVQYRKKQWVRPGSPGAQPKGKTRPQRGSCTLRLQGLQEPVKASCGGRAQLGGREGGLGGWPRALQALRAVTPFRKAH